MSLTSHKSADYIAASLCAALLAIFAATSWLSWRHTSATFDEPMHLVASRIQTELGDLRCDPDNPPLWKYFVSVGTDARDMPLDTTSPQWPAMLYDPVASQAYSLHALYPPSGVDADALIRAARDRMLLLGVLLAAIIAWWAWRLAGPVAALVAAAFFCLDPNFLAHSALIKNDVPITLLFTALMYAIWRVGRRATLPNCLIVAALVAASITTKFSGLLAIPILAVSLFARCLIPIDWPVFRWSARTFPRRCLAAAAIGLWGLLFSYFSIWACYGFRFDPAPGASADLNSAVRYYAFAQARAVHHAAFDPTPQIVQWLADWKPDALIQSVRWLHQQHLFPSTFLCGFVYVDGDTYTRSAYFLGQLSLHGWWNYFPVVIAVKTPLATLIALTLAILLTLFFCLNSRLPRDLWSIAALTLAPALYSISAFRSHLDLGIRHILPIYPFLFIFIGVIAARAVARFGKPAAAVIGLLLLGLAVETFAAFPNFIPFFNVAAGGYRDGERLLGDSNIDWGQNLPALADWQRQHPDYQLLLYYFGSADPRYYHIHYGNLPGSFAPPDQRRPTGQRPYWAMSVVALQGQYLDAKQRQFYEPFRERQPTEIIGGSIYLYAPW
jgi:hypothetical protein